MSKTITREFGIQLRELSAEDIENRTATFVISTEAVDSYGTVFRSDGWDLSDYKKNPIVAYGHRTWGDDPDNILGTSEIWTENNTLLAKVRFEDADVNPKADKVWKKVQAGTLRMASVGAIVSEGHWGQTTAGEDPNVLYFTRQKLYEWSIVPVGSNPDALKRNTEDMAEINAMFPKENETRSTGDENKGLKTFEAQIIINQNHS